MRVHDNTSVSLGLPEREEAANVASRLVRNLLASAGRVEEIHINVSITSEVPLLPREEA